MFFFPRLHVHSLHISLLAPRTAVQTNYRLLGKQSRVFRDLTSTLDILHKQVVPRTSSYSSAVSAHLLTWVHRKSSAIYFFKCTKFSCHQASECMKKFYLLLNDKRKNKSFLKMEVGRLLCKCSWIQLLLPYCKCNS